ncbi:MULTISPECIES: phage major capsid protein [unclassified Kribbella]|uniref:phage major capsid protein n=1 Tax=unclassified Kribbella TaxID=2644121 RepID=UPI00301755E7
MSIIDTLKTRRAELAAEATKIAETAHVHKRDLSSGEEQRFDAAIAEVEKIDERLAQLEGSEKRAQEIEQTYATLQGQPVTRGGTPADRHPLAFSPQSLDALQMALDSRSAGRFVAADVEQRAALATTTYGAPRAWGSNVTSGPRLLHVAAGVPQQPVDAVLAQVPNLTLPTASASVGENVSLAEYAASTAGSVTLARFGRWTDLSRESMVGTDAGAIVGMHQIGCAKDLDKVLIDAVETAAGAAVAFTADVPAAVRKAMAAVIDNTAAGDASDLVIMVHPDNAALLQDVSPIGGQTIAEGFQKFSGALVYPSSAANTGFVTVANLKAGARYFEARGLVTETDTAIKTGTLTVATSVIGGYGLGLVGGASGFAIMVDVVTP